MFKNMQNAKDILKFQKQIAISLESGDIDASPFRTELHVFFKNVRPPLQNHHFWCESLLATLLDSTGWGPGGSQKGIPEGVFRESKSGVKKLVFLDNSNYFNQLFPQVICTNF